MTDKTFGYMKRVTLKNVVLREGKIYLVKEKIPQSINFIKRKKVKTKFRGLDISDYIDWQEVKNGEIEVTIFVEGIVEGNMDDASLRVILYGKSYKYKDITKYYPIDKNTFIKQHKDTFKKCGLD